MSRTVSETDVREAVARERARLYAEAGLAADAAEYRPRPERPFVRAERERVTVLFGGLTRTHDRLIQAVGHMMGSRMETIPTPTKDDFQTGREMGNNGMCNPTYFTAGALINYLRRLQHEQGLSVGEIVNRYVFLTPGSCGPCRFGMYEAEYRLALRNSGYAGFRVFVLDQYNFERDEDAGLELSPRVFVPTIAALFLGDLLNDLANYIRPYEVEPGATDRVFDAVVDRVAERIAARNPAPRRPGLRARLLHHALMPSVPPGHIQLILDHLLGDEWVAILRDCAAYIDEHLETDYTQPRPVCKITGEFWAQTTEGDGNFNMFRFLQREGAEVLTEPTATWFFYLLAQARSKLEDRRGLDMPRAWNLPGRALHVWRFRASWLKLTLAYRLVVRDYNRMRAALGDVPHAPADQFELQRLADPYYPRKCVGGEGHLEVAKSIYYTRHTLAHMVLSLKPFGCLPSTQSDGAQAAVMADHPDLNFLAVETSGEGDVNAHSRVMMVLSEARARCRGEFDACLARTGYGIGQIRDYVRSHPDLRRPLQQVPREPGVAGKAASFVLHVARRMDADPAVPGPQPA